MLKKFQGSFQALTHMGIEYQNQQRFTPLHGAGKPLWEFKEHDHRLYCLRNILPSKSVEIVLLSGWIKDKKGKAIEETREIERAKKLLTEMQQPTNTGRKS